MKTSDRQLCLAWVLAVTGLLAFSSAKQVVAEDAVAQKVVGQAFEREILGGREDHFVAATQIRLHRVFRQRIEAVDRFCGLNEVQKKKLELAGRGAIKQLFESIEEQKRIFLSPEVAEQNVLTFLQQTPEIGALRVKFRSAPFDDDSLFAKLLRNVLTPEQAARYDQRSELAAASKKAITLANAGDLVRTARLPKDVYQIVWNRDGKQLGLVEFNRRVEIFVPPADQAVRIVGEGKLVVGFDFSPDENVVAIGENSVKATIINLAAGNEIQLTTGHAQPSVQFSPDGKLLATGGYGTKAKLWSATTGELVREFDVGPAEGGLTPVFSRDGTVLAVGHRNSTTRLFDAASGRLLHTLNKSMSQGLRFDSTGKTLAVVYVDGSLTLWDVPTGTLKTSVQSPADELYTIDWTPDGSTLVTAGHNSQITLWNPADLSIVSELASPEWVISARFSPDGTKLLCAGGNRIPQAERYVETWAVP